MKLKVLAVGFLASVALLAAALCPVDDKAGYFTGKTQTVSGVLMKEYKCPMGHVYWSRT